jgi:hypothetical protein
MIFSATLLLDKAKTVTLVFADLNGGKHENDLVVVGGQLFSLSFC